MKTPFSQKCGEALRPPGDCYSVIALVLRLGPRRAGVGTGEQMWGTYGFLCNDCLGNFVNFLK